MKRPMRLIMLNYEYPPIGGGAGTGSKFLAEELARQGHMVEVLTSAFANLPKRTQRLYPSGGRLRIRRLPVLRKEAGRCRPHEMCTYIFSAFWQLLRRNDFRRTDAIISFHTIPSGVPALPISWFFGIPHIALFRGGDVPGFLGKELRLLHTVTYPLNALIVAQCARAVANSKGLRFMAQRAFPFKEIDVVANGVESERFSPTSNSSGNQPNSQEPMLFFAGRMTTQKGLDVLGKALVEVRDLAWKMVLAGEGPERAKLELFLRQNNLDHRVEFTGWQARQKLVELYQKTSVFVFPTRYEGMPNALLEAMSSGCAVITTPVAGCVELVEHEANGLLVPVDDSAALAKAIRRLLLNPTLAQKLGSDARHDAVSHWSWRARAQELEGLILSATCQ